MRYIKGITIAACLFILFAVPACVSPMQREINNLHDKDADVRRNAVKTIGEMGDPQVEEVLAQAIKDSDPSVRKTVVETLARIGDRDAIEPLFLQILADRDDGVRKAALWELGKLNAGKVTKAYILNNNLMGNFWKMNQYVIGYKSDTQSTILAQIIKTLINEQIESKLEDSIFASTREFKTDAEVQQALENKEIHVAIEYTVVAFTEVLGQQGEKDPHKIFDLVKSEYYKKKSNLIWMNPFGFAASKEIPSDPDSYAAAVIRWNLLQSNPALGRAIKKLIGRIDNTAMANMAEQISNGGKSVQDVAKEFLKNKIYNQKN